MVFLELMEDVFEVVEFFDEDVGLVDFVCYYDEFFFVCEFENFLNVFF